LSFDKFVNFVSKFLQLSQHILLSSLLGQVECVDFSINQTSRCARGWTGRKYRFSSVWYDPVGNRTQPASFGGACSINYITLSMFPVTPLCLIHNFPFLSAVVYFSS